MTGLQLLLWRVTAAVIAGPAITRRTAAIPACLQLPFSIRTAAIPAGVQLLFRQTYSCYSGRRTAVISADLQLLLQHAYNYHYSMLTATIIACLQHTYSCYYSMPIAAIVAYLQHTYSCHCSILIATIAACLQLPIRGYIYINMSCCCCSRPYLLLQQGYSYCYRRAITFLWSPRAGAGAFANFFFRKFCFFPLHDMVRRIPKSNNGKPFYLGALFVSIEI